MSDSPILDLALRLWPQARDHGTVDDPSDLDILLGTQGRPGAAGYEAGVRRTFAAFPPDREARFTLPTGEQTDSDASARFIGHVLVLRTLLAAGLSIDERVSGALADAHALSWTATGGGNYYQSPLALALSLWLVVLDPDSDSDRPLPIDWSAPFFADTERWDPEERLFSHYDVRERALDWAAYVSYDPRRHEGASVWTLVEPLLRLDEQDARARLALSQLAVSGDSGERASAAAMIERSRIAGLLRSQLSSGNGSGALPPGIRQA